VDDRGIKLFVSFVQPYIDVKSLCANGGHAMPKESFKVELIFDDETGDLFDVVALEGVGSEHGKKVEIGKLSGAKLNKATSHSLLFVWGSPGCVVIKTSTGYKQICS
jgi:hypothetical protein